MDLVYDLSNLRMRHLVGLSLVIWVGAIPIRAEGNWLPLRVRLVGPVHSDVSKPGDLVEAVVTAPLIDNGVTRISVGARVLGRVAEARPVGLGLRRERAGLTIEFDTLDPTGLGDRARLALRLAAVDNARETVTRQGEIRGILAADHAPVLLRGVWFRPNGAMFHRTALGMTGVASRLPVGPIGSIALMGLRCLAFRLPEPEIHLPAGTDLQLEVALDSLATLAPSELAGPPSFVLSNELAEWLMNAPHQTFKPDGKPAQDIINVVAIGTAEQLANGFLVAGWSTADRMSSRSFARAYKAYTAHKGYPNAPVSKLLYEDREPDLVFQKSFNTLSKRHHVRFWRVNTPLGGEPVWLGAGTHDTGVIFDRARLSVTHEIDPRIDLERGRVVSDLSFAGCASEEVSLARPEIATQPGVATDRRLAVVRMIDCQASPLLPAGSKIRAARSLFFRATRRVTLETRHYLMRGNVYYYAYRGIRSTLRGRSDRRAVELAALRTDDSGAAGGSAVALEANSR